MYNLVNSIAHSILHGNALSSNGSLTKFNNTLCIAQ